MRAALFAALVALASAPALAADKPEPKYEGKPLDYWLARFQKAENEKDRDAAFEALKAFGPDAAPALPTFIEMLADHSPEYRRQVVEIIGAIGPKAKDARPIIAKRAKETRDRDPFGYGVAIAVILWISSEPKDAVPELIPLLGEGDWNYYALHAICNIGPDANTAIPAVRQCVLKELADAQKDGRIAPGLSGLTKLGPDVVPLLVEMLDAHGGIGRETALEYLQELGPKAVKAAPALVKLLKNGAPATRLRAATALWQVEENPSAVAALAELMKLDPEVYHVRNPGYSKERNSSIALDAAQALGEIGPAAQAALPQLRRAVALSWMLWWQTRGANSPFVVRSGGPGVLPVSIGPSNSEKELYRQWEAVEARLRLGRAAAEAIRKIEGKAEK